MANTFIFKKLVDMSVLHAGMSIPASVQEIVYTALNRRVQKGESYPIKLLVEQGSYDATINNIGFDSDKYPNRVDVLQIRYTENSNIAHKLRSIFIATTKLVSEYSHERADKSTQLAIPAEQREYINIYATEVLGTIRLECIPHISIKPGAIPLRFIPSFPIGSEVTNDQLRIEFTCGNMGGIRRSKAKNALVIISDHTKALYDDKWHGDVLHYTGMGLLGDQVLNGNQNKTLFESKTNGVDLHLFEVFESTKYIYQGPVELSGDPYQENQLDQDGNDRSVWMFPLRVTHLKPLNSITLDSYLEKQQYKALQLSPSKLIQKASEQASKVPSNRSVTSTVFVRDVYVAAYTRQAANGICDLCGQQAPFSDKQGKPYLESHHVIWLAEGGEDTIQNTVALCPNCHRKVHIVNDSKDKDFLLKKAKNR